MLIGDGMLEEFQILKVIKRIDGFQCEIMSRNCHRRNQIATDEQL